MDTSEGKPPDRLPMRVIAASIAIAAAAMVVGVVVVVVHMLTVQRNSPAAPLPMISAQEPPATQPVMVLGPASQPAALPNPAAQVVSAAAPATQNASEPNPSTEPTPIMAATEVSAPAQPSLDSAQPAPPTTEAAPVVAVKSYDFGDVTITNSSPFKVVGLTDQSKAFISRNYLWENVPAQLAGWQYTHTNGGRGQKVELTAHKAATIFAAVADDHTAHQVDGWTPVSGLAFSYNDTKNTKMHVYSRSLAAGDVVDLPDDNFSGFVVLIPPGPGITLTPPGPAASAAPSAAQTSTPKPPPVSPAEIAAARSNLAGTQKTLDADLSADAGYQNALTNANAAEAVVQSLRNSNNAGGEDLATASQQWIAAKNSLAAEFRRARASNSTIDADATAVQKAQAALDALLKPKVSP